MDCDGENDSKMLEKMRSKCLDAKVCSKQVNLLETKHY
jgi:hypothetical protein